MITEGSIIEYRCEHGYNMKGKVSQVYTSVTGKRCVDFSAYNAIQRWGSSKTRRNY
uniref:Sushi domain-containing protein n=2 Tax=unclassified Kayfunavirus TaxID=2749939 RepID=A0AAU8GH39_9CAUD